MVRIGTRLNTRVEQWRRDLGMLVGPFVGRRPSPLISRGNAPARHPAPAPAIQGRAMTVLEVVRETPDAMSLWLEGDGLAFEPGQFLTFLVEVGGEKLRRAYSISSHVRDLPRVRVTIKRVAGGRVSNHLHDTVQAGHTLRVLGPSGDFVVGGQPEHILLVGGGSGITPLMAIAQAALAAGRGPRVTMIYGNRRLEDVIFEGELAALAEAHPDRFAVRHVLSEPPEVWRGGEGMLDEATCRRELEAMGVTASMAFVCGPEPMMEAARAALEAAGLDERAIREERFTQPHLRPTSPVASASQLVTLRVGDEHATFRTEAGQTLLDAGLAAGGSMDFSCAMGGCAACKLRLVEGTVEMEEPNCLTRGEREAGMILACVARPTSTVVIEAP